MIALSNDATCPNCQDATKRPKVCWSCRNTRRVEAWRVCPTCGCWIDACTCPLATRITGAPMEQRQRGRPWPRPLPPAPPGFDPPVRTDPLPDTGEGIGLREQPETPAAVEAADLPAIEERGQTQRRPCWLGVTLETCGLVEYSDGFYLCRRCGFVYREE